MYNKTVVQPHSLSALEWTLLQQLSACGTPFHLNDVFTSLSGVSSSPVETNMLKFFQQFYRLKSAGYLVIVPVAFMDVTKQTRPLYKLTVQGRKTIEQEG